MARLSTRLRNFVSNAVQYVTAVNGKVGDIFLNKGDVGLGNVDNTSDVNKPISTAQQTALDAKLASLDWTDPINLVTPSTVVDQYFNRVVGLNGQTLETNMTTSPSEGDWIGVKGPGTVNASNASGLVLTAKESLLLAWASEGWRAMSWFNNESLNTNLNSKVSTATFNTHVSDTANPHGVTAAQVGLGNVDNTSDVDKPVSTAQQTALDELQEYLTAQNFVSSSSNHYPPKATKIGQIYTQSLSGFARGVAWGTVMDIQKVYPTFPYKYIAYGSTDHNPAPGTLSGLRVWVSDSKDSGWLPWTDSGVQTALTGASITIPTEIGSSNGAITITGFPAVDDKGEFFTAIYYSGQFWLYGHSFGLTSDQTQTAWYATSSDGLNYTYGGAIHVSSHDDQSTPVYLHNGYNSCTVEGGSVVMYSLLHHTDTSMRTRWTSYDGVHFAQDTSCDAWGRYPQYLGENTKKITTSLSPMFINGQYWGIGGKQNLASGTGLGNSEIIIFRSDEKGNPIAMPTMIGERGAASSFDENGLRLSSCILIEDGTAHVFYTGRSSANVNSIGLITLDLTTPEYDAAPAFTVQSGYEALSSTYGAFQMPDTFLRGYQEVRVAFTGSTIPSGFTAVDGDGLVSANDLTSGGGGIILAGGASVSTALQWTDMTFDPTLFKEFWVTFEGVTLSEDFVSGDFLTMGLRNVPGGSAYYLSSYVPTAGTPAGSGELRYINNSTSTVATQIQTWDWLAVAASRQYIPTDFTLGYTNRKNSEDGTYTQYVELWVDNKLIQAVPCVNLKTDIDYLPVIAVTRNTVNLQGVTARFIRNQP